MKYEWIWIWGDTNTHTHTHKHTHTHTDTHTDSHTYQYPDLAWPKGQAEWKVVELWNQGTNCEGWPHLSMGRQIKTKGEERKTSRRIGGCN